MRTTLGDMCRIAKIKQILRNNDASAEFIKAAEKVYKTLHKDYDMNFRRILFTFTMFIEIHTTFRHDGWETTDTMKYDPHFMRVWYRLLKRCKPLLLKCGANNVIITCLYLTYSLHAIEIGYPLRPFLKYAESAHAITTLSLRIINGGFISIPVLTRPNDDV